MVLIESDQKDKMSSLKMQILNNLLENLNKMPAKRQKGNRLKDYLVLLLIT